MVSRVSHGRRDARIGIYDVATAAGVSVTTVSHALNDKGRLPESTRRRVKQAAERLGYRPSKAAQHLVTGRSGLLGLTITAPGGTSARALADIGYFVQVVSAASTAALASGYSLILTAGTDDAKLTPPIDGAIVIDPVGHDPTLRALRSAGTPVVTIGRSPDRPGTAWVDNDHRAGASRILAHLERQGARSVALISPPLTTMYAMEIHSTYTAFCIERKQRPRVVFARRALGESAGFTAAIKLLDEGAPDAILGGLDRLALGALLAANTRNIAVPDSLLVVAYSDSPLNLQASPSVTALQLHPDQIGARAVQILIDMIEGRNQTDRHVEVPVRLIARGSTMRGGR